MALLVHKIVQIESSYSSSIVAVYVANMEESDTEVHFHQVVCGYLASSLLAVKWHPSSNQHLVLLSSK